MTDYYVGEHAKIVETKEGRRTAEGELTSITIIGDESKGEGIFKLDDVAHYTHRFRGVSLGRNDKGDYVRVEKGAEITNG